MKLRHAAALALVSILAFVALIVSSTWFAAFAGTNRVFSDADLSGKYFVSYASNYLGYHGDPQTEPRIGSGEITFDGHGNVTGRNTSSIYGKEGALIAGTYHVNPDGTGTMVTTTTASDGTVTTTELNFKFDDSVKIRFGSPERALDPIGTPRTVGRPYGIMGTFRKE